jgi:hypothetical protein
MITIEQVYEKLVQLTELCDREFKAVRADIKKLSKKFDELGHDTYDLRGRVAVLEDQHDSK